MNHSIHNIITTLTGNVIVTGLQGIVIVVGIIIGM